MPKQLKKCYPSNRTDLIRRVTASPRLKVIVLQMKQTGKGLSMNDVMILVIDRKQYFSL